MTKQTSTKMTQQTYGLPYLIALIFLLGGLLASAFATEKVRIQKRSSGCPTEIWSNWTNRDKPTTTWVGRETGEGDNEYFDKEEIRSFCPNGITTNVECVPADSSIHASRYSYTCDIDKDLVCANGDNSAGGCADFQIRYKCTIPCPIQEKTQGETTSPTVWKVHAGVCGALFLVVLLLLGKVFFMAKK